MVERVAYIVKSSPDNRRHVCVDKDNEKEIMDFLKKDKLRINKFNDVINVILAGLRNCELYDKEEVSAKAKGVTAMKLLKGSQNIRLYCKEQRTMQGVFYVIVSELLKKKKDNKVSKKIKPLIEKVGGYEYVIRDREESKEPLG